MTPVHELLSRCASHDDEGWTELWRIVESVSLPPIQRQLYAHGLDVSLADDVLQELYLYLQAGSLKRLRLFRGTCDPQFRAYLQTIVIRFTKRVLRRWCRARRREAAALRDNARPSPGGPTDSQLQQALRELMSALPKPDRIKLRTVSHCRDLLGEGGTLERSGTDVPARTARRWRNELYRKYRRLV
jgi:hypothetical protein